MLFLFKEKIILQYNVEKNILDTNVENIYRSMEDLKILAVTSQFYVSP